MTAISSFLERKPSRGGNEYGIAQKKSTRVLFPDIVSTNPILLNHIVRAFEVLNETLSETNSSSRYVEVH